MLCGDVPSAGLEFVRAPQLMPIMLVDAPSTATVAQVIADDWYAPNVRNWNWFYCDATRQFIGTFMVGEVLYRPTGQLIGLFEPPTPDISGRFSVSGLSSLVGRGRTINEARADWELSVDAMIQRLFGTQDFERSTDEQENMRQLSQCFDLTEIRYALPLQVRNCGKLVSVFPRPWKVRWIDGTSSDLSRHQVPAELVRFSVGQEFEAVVEQDSRTGDLVKIVSVFKSARKQVSDRDVTNLLSRATSSKDLPDLDWD
ncbi:MAG: hypothetical protein R3C49_00575 [Planctomycetaceae bacterium]